MFEDIAKHLIKFIVWMAAAVGCYYLSKYLGTLHPVAGRISTIASFAVLIGLKIAMSMSFVMVLGGIIFLFILSMAGLLTFTWLAG
jgi:hypothetical protein